MRSATDSRTIPEIALREFTQRRARLRKAVENGDWPADPANESARLWLAIALAAGAGPKLPRDVLSAIEIDCIFPPGKRMLPRPEHLADPADYIAELARARDVAFARADGTENSDRLQRAFDLDALAEALGAPPPVFPAREQRSAA